MSTKQAYKKLMHIQRVRRLHKQQYFMNMNMKRSLDYNHWEAIDDCLFQAAWKAAEDVARFSHVYAVEVYLHSGKAISGKALK